MEGKGMDGKTEAWKHVHTIGLIVIFAIITQVDPQVLSTCERFSLNLTLDNFDFT